MMMVSPELKVCLLTGCTLIVFLELYSKTSVLVYFYMRRRTCSIHGSSKAVVMQGVCDKWTVTHYPFRLLR